MSTNNRIRSHPLALIGYLGLVAALLACSVVGGAQVKANETVRVNNGIIETQDEGGGLASAADETTFELVGELQSADPWTVAGVTLETNDSTQIAEGLKAGDRVRVRGVLREDETWLAYSIEPANEQADAVIILIGVVDSTDPWVVNGIELTVTDETEVQAGIEAGKLVRVEIRLLPDGTWQVLSIVLLGEVVEVAGCMTVVATVVSVSGNTIQFLGWSTTVTLDLGGQTGTTGNDNNGNDNDGNDNDGNDNNAGSGNNVVTVNLRPGQIVLAVVCVKESGFVIVQIVILDTDDENPSNNGNTEKVLVCHKPNNKRGGITLSIAAPAVPAHLAHGDTLGPCP
jgi:hypothetical protein